MGQLSSLPLTGADIFLMSCADVETVPARPLSPFTPGASWRVLGTPIVVAGGANGKKRSEEGE